MSTADDIGRVRARRGAGASRRLTDAAGEVKASANAAILALYTISIIFPIKFQIGPAYMTVSRIMIIVLLIPMLLRLFSGAYGGIKRTDYLVFFYCIWAFIALAANHGVGAVLEFAGMHFIEIAGAYLIGRIYIRSFADIYCFVKYLLIAIAFSVPFVLLEMRTGNPIILDVLRQANPAPQFFKLPPFNNYEPRMGFYRSQFTLVHPILYGVFCASLMAFALTLRSYDKGVFFKGVWGGIVLVATFASLSSAALLSAVLQLALLGFERVSRFVKARWKLMGAGFVAAYVIIDILSNRSPVEVFISIFTFNTATSYNRILIWEYGSAEVWRNPIFGIGNNDWIRPDWMVPSVDNHWLLQTMRYGLPGGLALIYAYLWVLFKVGRVDMSKDPMMQQAQRGYLICMVAWFVALGTVAINVEVASYMMTMIAAGIWMIDATPGGEPEEAGASRRRGGRTRRSLRNASPKQDVSNADRAARRSRRVQRDPRSR